MRLLEERSEMRVNEYESAMLGQNENLMKNSPEITELMLKDADLMESDSDQYVSSL
jgi:hypothetical protein